MKKLLSSLLGLLLLTACSAQQIDEGKEPLKIGGAFALTSFAATWGEADLNGATLAIEEINAKGGINGRKVELIVEDTQTDGKATVSAARKLMNVDDIEVIIGPTWADSYGGASPIAEIEQVVLLTPSAAIKAVEMEINYPYTFSTWYSAEEEIRGLVEYFDKNDYRKIAIITELDNWWTLITNVLEEEIKKTDGIDLIKNMKLQANSEDFRTQLMQLKQLQPDAIFFGHSHENSTRTFLKQRAEVFPDSLLFTTEYIEELAEKEDYKPLLFNMKFIAPKVDLGDFAERYKERFGKGPVFSASNAYDATRMILEAFGAGKTTGPEIKEFLENNEFDTVTFGKVRFDEIGGIQGGEFVVKEVKDGKIVELE